LCDDLLSLDMLEARLDELYGTPSFWKWLVRHVDLKKLSLDLNKHYWIVLHQNWKLTYANWKRQVSKVGTYTTSHDQCSQPLLASSTIAIHSSF
jgi:hypothetical protein